MLPKVVAFEEAMAVACCELGRMVVQAVLTGLSSMSALLHFRPRSPPLPRMYCGGLPGPPSERRRDESYGIDM